MITFRGITETSLGLTVKDIKRAVLPPVKNRLVTRSGVDGSIDMGSDLGEREFVVTFQSKESLTLDSLQNVRRAVAEWLFPEDRESHQLEFDDEPTLYYWAKVDGNTDINQILEYGSFEVKFICTEIEAFKNDSKGQTPIILFKRESTAYGTDYAIVAENEPRYSGDGVIIEQEVTNNAHNAKLTSGTGGLPDQYETYSGLGGVGTITTAANKSTIEITTSTQAGSWAGMREASGTWHVFGSSSYYSSMVLCRVTSGNVKARMKLHVLDSGFSTYWKTVETTSTDWIVIRLQDESVGTDYAVGIGFETVSIGSGDLGTAEFIFPQLEVTSRHNNIWYETGTKLIDGASYRTPAAIPNDEDWSIGILVQPLWDSAGVQASYRNAGVWSFLYDNDNYIDLEWEHVTGQFRMYISIGGSILYAESNGPSFSTLNSIRLLLERTGDYYTLSMNVNGGTVYTGTPLYDSRDVPSSIRLGLLGFNHSGTAANSILAQLEWNPDNYFSI